MKKNRQKKYVISVANQKGGSGKTTTAVNLSACLTEKGYQVLLIDLDPQSQASTWWRCEEKEPKASVFDALLETKTINTPLATLGLQVHDGLILWPSAGVSPDDEARLNSQPKRFLRLKEKLDELDQHYDFVIIDCPPTLGVLMQNALLASDAVILTVETSFLALHGMGRMLQLIQEIRRQHSIEVFALPTIFEKRTTDACEILEDMQKYFKESLLKTVIRKNVRLKEAASCGEPIIRYDPSSYGAQDYSALTVELLQKIG